MNSHCNSRSKAQRGDKISIFYFELFGRGIEIWHQTLEAIKHPGNSLDYIFSIGHAYRNFALSNSSYYSLMFLKVIPEYTPSENNFQLATESFKILVETVQDCTAPGKPAESEAWEIARIIWATLHGHIGLELVGYANYPEPPEQRFELVNMIQLAKTPWLIVFVAVVSNCIDTILLKQSGSTANSPGFLATIVNIWFITAFVFLCVCGFVTFDQSI